MEQSRVRDRAEEPAEPESCERCFKLVRCLVSAAACPLTPVILRLLLHVELQVRYILHHLPEEWRRRRVINVSRLTTGCRRFSGLLQPPS